MNTQAHCFLSFIAKSCQFNHAWPHRPCCQSLLPRLRPVGVWRGQLNVRVKRLNQFCHCEWVPSHFCFADTSYMDTPVQVIACSIAMLLTQAHSSHVISILCKLPQYSLMWSWDSPRICTWIHGQCPALLWQRPPKHTCQQPNYIVLLSRCCDSPCTCLTWSWDSSETCLCRQCSALQCCDSTQYVSTIDENSL